VAGGESGETNVEGMFSARLAAGTDGIGFGARYPGDPEEVLYPVPRSS